MKQEDFADIVWKQWATAPNEEIQIEELRPMGEVQLTGKRGSGVKDAPWMFTAWAVAYPDDDDPWMSDSIKRDQRMMESVMGINMVLDNEELFRQKELMVDIDEAFITETTDKDGNEIIVQEMGYRSVLPFLSTFNKSAYDVIFREHQRLLKKIGESYLAKALLRFETWFKQNGIVDHNEIEPFWSTEFDADAIGAANEPDPPPLSDAKSVVAKKSGRKWSELYIKVEMAVYKSTTGRGKSGNWLIKTKWRGGKYKTYKLNELGFATKAGKPYERFELLGDFAKGRGFLDPQTRYGTVGRERLLRERDKLTQRITRLRKHLKKVFRVDDDPIKYRNGTWSIQFAECVLSVADAKEPQASDCTPPDDIPDDISDASATAYRATVRDIENISGLESGGLADLQKDWDKNQAIRETEDEPDD